MRARRLELRLLAAVLAGLWAADCVLLLGWYRPGGPLDLAVGLAAIVPAGVAAAAVARPPVPGDRLSFLRVAWLGLLTILVLVPLVTGIAAIAAGHDPQVIVPSPEIAYAWVVALAGTSLFAGLGLVGRTAGQAPERTLGPAADRAARPLLGPAADQRRRLVTAAALAAVLAGASAGLMGGATLANAAALRERPAASSPFGPTDPGLVPPACDGDLGVGATATLSARLTGEADREALGDATIEGARSGDDVGWTADVATPAEAGPAGAVAVGADGWQREPGTDWVAIPASSLAGERLDATVLAAALVPERLIAAEDRGLVRVEGAPARHCRVAIDGAIFRAAFPQVRWFAGDRSLHRWRGEIDYYVFGDGQLGLVEAWVNGEAEPVAADAIQATIRASLSATNRGEPLTLEPPTGG